MGKITQTVSLIALLVLVAGCAVKPAVSPKLVVGAIVPHHLLVESYIDDFYALLAKQIQPELQPERIILISPNHFNYGVRYIQTTTETPQHQYDGMLDLASINSLADVNVAFIENEKYSKEHGIFVHYPFIQKYFPAAKVVPVTLKSGTPQAKINEVVEQLRGDGQVRTLVIASVDFTHYVSDEIAIKNDNHIIDYLKKWSGDVGSRENFSEVFASLKRLAQSEKGSSEDVVSIDAVAMDSPESIYLLLKYLDGANVHKFNLWKRTSTFSVTGITEPTSNTSHIFAYFN